MTHEHLLVVLGVDGNFSSANVIAFAGEGAIKTNLIPVTVHIKRNAALQSCLFERGFRLQPIDVDVSGRCQEIGGQMLPMLRFASDE